MGMNRGIWRPAGTPCDFPGCERQARAAHGLCSTHRHQQKRWGYCLPIGLRPPGNHGQMTDTPTYSTIHQLVRRWFGKASEHPCEGCGEQARNWSYDHSDPNPLWHVRKDRPNPIPYSADPSRYRPLCSKCHAALDLAEAVKRR